MTLASRRLSGDSGLGLVLVLGMGAILTGLMIISTTAAIRSLASSRQHVSFESALAVADGGIDIGLARARTTYVATGADSYTMPALVYPPPPSATPAETCLALPVAWPWAANVQPTAEQERNWARKQLEILADTPGCLKNVKNGQYTLLKPTGRQSVYSLGWSPKRGAKEVKTRLIKAEYLFTPYSPTHAILTQGNMTLSSSTSVTSAPPNSPTLAAVHSNGQVFVAGGNPSVSGAVTQGSTSGSYASSNNFAANTGGNVKGAAEESIPFENAEAVWRLNRTTSVPGGWYDLCPDGTVQLPTGAAPCAGGTPQALTAGAFRGWSFDATAAVPTWRGGTGIKTGGNSGTYYIHHGNVTNPASNAGAAVPNLTVLASSSVLTCNKVGGNIEWGSTDVLAPSLTSTWLVADQDLTTTSNYKAGSASGGTVVSGLFIAGDQIDMSTSSAGAYGAVVVTDQCDPANGLSPVDSSQIKNPSIYYDPNAQAPFTNVINNTLWLEYVG